MFEEGLLKQAVVNANDAIVITEDTPDTPIVYANDAFLKMSGYSLSEVLGQHPGHLLQGDNTCKITKQKIRQALNEKKSIRAEILNYNKDGKEYWAEMNVFHHVCESKGYFISIQRDVTERREMEAALMEYKVIFDDLPIAIIRTSITTGEFLMANQMAAIMLGYDNVPELMEGVRSTDLYPVEDRARLIKEIRKNGKVSDHEIKLHLPCGKEIWVSANMHINCDGDCIEGSLIDVTELVNLRNRQLEIAQSIALSLDMKLASLEK